MWDINYPIPKDLVPKPIKFLFVELSNCYSVKTSTGA